MKKLIKRARTKTFFKKEAGKNIRRLLTIDQIEGTFRHLHSDAALNVKVKCR